MSHLARDESFKRENGLDFDEIRKREFFLFLSVEWFWRIFEIFDNFNIANFNIFDYWNFGFSTQQMDFTIFKNLSNSTKCYQTTRDNLYAQAWILRHFSDISRTFSVILPDFRSGSSLTDDLKILNREQRELMEELNRPPEFNLSIFDSSNLKLFESESKNEIFYEIVPFIVQSRPILITFFGLSCLFLVLSLVFTSLEWRKLSITISVFNFVLFSGYVCLFLGLSSTTFDVFEPLFSFRLQHHNYQRNGYIRTLSDWTTATSTNHQLENLQ